MQAGNLYRGIPRNHEEEWFETIAAGNDCRIERIVSCGHRSGADSWYDQEQDEWVCVLAGRACLQIEDGSMIDLEPGDHVLLPSHLRHRVENTAEDEVTIWLAVHMDSGETPPER